MLDIQLGRRNLSPIQRIAIAEKYRSLYERQAKENLVKAGSNYGIGKEKPLPNLVNPISTIDTTKKLTDVAGVGKETYRMGAKILNSDNEEIKQAVLSGEMSINAGYNKTLSKPISVKEVLVIQILSNLVDVLKNLKGFMALNMVITNTIGIRKFRSPQYPHKNNSQI